MKVKVYRKDTGEVVRVPAHFLDHPVLGKPFRKTPSQKAQEQERAAREAASAPVTKTSTERAGSAAAIQSTDEPASPGDKK